MDRIFIHDLLVRCIVGVDASERREKQDVVLSLSIAADLSKAGKSDDIKDAVDYRALKKKVLAMVEGSSYYLIEALAEAVASLCLEDPAIKEVQVRVEKPSALRFARTVGVEITRGRKDRS